MLFTNKLLVYLNITTADVLEITRDSFILRNINNKHNPKSNKVRFISTIMNKDKTSPLTKKSCFQFYQILKGGKEGKYRTKPKCSYKRTRSHIDSVCENIHHT